MKFALAAALLLVLPVSAQQITHNLKHSISAPLQTNSWWGSGGYSVAVAGNYIVVGSPFDDTDATDAGIVRVYGVTTGQLYFVLRNPTPATDDRFGVSVSISVAAGGIHRVVVGAHRDDTGATDAGSAYVFVISSTPPGTVTTPAVTHTLNNPTPFLNDRFGASVAISGTKAVIGADGDDTNATSAGSAYVYELATTNSTPTVPVATLNNPNAGLEDHFAYAVAISGTRVVVGAPDHNFDATLTNAGRAYVYDLVILTLSSCTTTTTAPGTTVTCASTTGLVPGMQISGPNIAVGTTVASVTNGTSFVLSQAATGSGSSLTLTAFDGAQPPVATLNNPTPAISDHFGQAVAVSGTRVAVGAPDDDSLALDAGSTYVYDLSGSGVSTTAGPPCTVTHPNPAAGDHFGNSLAMSTARLVVGAPDDDVLDGSVTLTSCTTTTTAPGTTVTCSSTTGLVPGMQISGTNIASGTTVASITNSTSFVLSQAATGSGSSLTLTAFVSLALTNCATTLAGTTVTCTSTTGLVPGMQVSGPNIASGTTVASVTNGTSFVLSQAATGSGSSLTLTASVSITDVGSAHMYNLSSSGTPSVPTAALFVTLYQVAERAFDFGRSVAILSTGLRAVVGAPIALTDGAYEGKAYYYDINTPLTTPLLRLQATSPDNFGTSVAISGTRMVVGVPFGYDETLNVPAGRAYVYETSGTTPTLVATLNNPTPVDQRTAYDYFGWSVAISGTRVVVGAQGDNTSGSAYVYDLSSATPTVPVFTLPNPTPASGDSFGGSVAISGTRIVVGAYNDDTGATNAGSAYVYDLSSGTPTTPITSINNPSPSIDDFFGFSVAISGTRVVVGASDDGTDVSSAPADQRDQGSAYVYDFSGGFPTSATTPTFTLNNPSPENQDFFGTSVAVSGTRVVVGAPYDNTGATLAGSAYVYDFTGVTPPTVPAPTVLNEAAQNGFFFGTSVAIDGTRVVVGAPYSYYTAEDRFAGRSYVYNFSSGTPATSVARLNNPSPVNDDYFGSSVAISGTIIAVGTPYKEATVIGTPNGDVTAYDKGAAYVFVPIFPEIVMEQPAGTSLTSGTANLTFGSVNLGSTSAKTFTVTNTGPDALTIYSVSVTGGNAGDFPVTTTGMLTSVPASSSTTFSVAFTPTAPGVRTTTLRVINNDSDEGTFDITLTGTGVDGTSPDTTISSGPPALTNSRSATVPFSGTDNVAVTSFEGRLDGAAYATVTSPVTLTSLADGSHTFSVRAKDAAGNVDATPASVTWTVDGTAPVLTLPANIVAEATSSAGRVVTYSASASDPGSGVATSSFLPASGSTFAIGATTVNASATDNAGNTATGSFTVTVQDTTPPAISGVPANITAQATGPAGAVVTFASPTATDLVDGARTVTCTPASGSTFSIGTTTVTCSASDTRGNTSSATFTVTIQDTTPPVISGVPANITAQATGPAGAVVTFASPTATDLVDGTRTVTCTPASGSTFAISTTTVTCSASDTRGNTSSATFTVTIQDTTPPVISGVPANITTEATGPAGKVVTFAIPTATDIVDGARTVTCTPASGSTFVIGTTTVTCSASDTRGNTGSATFTVTVQDTTPPVISGVPANITTEATGPAGKVVTFTNPTATDLVDGSRAVTCTPASGSTFVIGTTTVTCSASDTRSNTSSATFTVTVQDTTAPAGGTMTMSPASPVDASATFTVSFAGWTDAASTPLTYSVLIDNVVVSAQGSTASRIVTAPATTGAHTLKGRIYDARNNLTGVTQSFTVNSAQQSWRKLHFGSTANSGIGADGADSDFDGIRNLLEYALGTNPTTPNNGSQLPQPVQSGGNLTLSITQPPGVTGITYGAQISTTMQSPNWTSSGVTDTDPSPTGYTFSAPFGTNPQMFMRIVITNTVD